MTRMCQCNNLKKCGAAAQNLLTCTLASGTSTLNKGLKNAEVADVVQVHIISGLISGIGARISATCVAARTFYEAHSTPTIHTTGSWDRRHALMNTRQKHTSFPLQLGLPDLSAQLPACPARWPRCSPALPTRTRGCLSLLC